MNVRRRAALVAITALSVAACGDDDDGSTADDVTAPSAVSSGVPDTTAADSTTVAPSTTAAVTTTVAATTTAAATTTTVDLATGLAGRTFVSTAVEGYQLVDGTEIALTFDGTNIGAVAGCNQMGSTWSLEGDVLVVPAPAMTAMACEPAALMDQDTWLAAVLTSRPTAALDGDSLTLMAEGTVVTLVDREAADPDRPLEGTTWNLHSIVTGDAVASLPAGAGTPTLRLEGGQLALDTGCNTGNGSYTLAGDQVTFGPLAMTRIACDGVTNDVEQAQLAVLTGTATAAVTDGVLTLSNGDRGLQYLAG